jgi:peptidyl-prolyl cis-trans isomerase D
MRKNAKSWLVKVLFGIIVIVFIFFYGYSDLRKAKDNVLASVGKTKITVAEYQEAYKSILQFYRNIYKGQLTEEMIKQMGLKQKALENLIDREVLLQEAEREKLRVDSEEVRKAIMQSPAFQENGAFSQANYERALRYYGNSVLDFERSQQKDLLINKLEDMIKSAVKVSDAEIKNRFQMENEKVMVDYVIFNPDTIKETFPVSDQEIDSYYKKQPEEFRVPEMAKAQYVVFSPQNYESKATVSLRDLQEAYQMDTERFSEPKKVKARHILIKLEKNATPEKEKEVKKRAEEILQKAQKGENFAKLAEKYSEDTGSAKKGGDLGYFKTGDMVKPFEEAAFSLKPGQLSSLVKTNYGFHIIKVEEVKEAYTKSFDEAKPILEKELKAEEAKKIAREEANRAYNRIFKSKDLSAYAKATSLTTEETNLFAFGKGPEDAVEKNAFSESAFSIAPGDLAPVFALGQKYVLLKLLEKKASHIAPVAEVKEIIRTTLEKEKKQNAAKERAEKLLASLKSGSVDWTAAVKEQKLEIKPAEFTRKGDYIPELGKARVLKDAAFNLTEKKLYADTVFQSDKGSVVIKFKQKQLPGEAEFAKQKDRLDKQVLQQKKEEIFNQFLESLKAKAEIKVDRKQIALD